MALQPDPIYLPISRQTLDAIAIILFVVAVSILVVWAQHRQESKAWLLSLRDKMGLTGLHPAIVAFLGLVWLMIAGLLVFGLFRAVAGLIWFEVPLEDDQIWDWRFGIAQIAALTTVLGAAIALPFTIMRLTLNRRQTETAEQGQITDRINKAVEGLGAEKEVSFQRQDSAGNLTYEKHSNGKPDYSKPVMVRETRPNLEVRIGAIYALERIAQDSDRDHVQIMEILCAYIRENAPAKDAEPWPVLEMKDSEYDGPLEEDWEVRKEIFESKHSEMLEGLTCRTDIQAALSVIGRRSAHQRQLEAAWGHEDTTAEFMFDAAYPDSDALISEDERDPKGLTEFKEQQGVWQSRALVYSGYRLDLRQTNLRQADLSGLSFAGAMFNEAQMQGADLYEAQMQGTGLRGAQMQGANLYSARMQGAGLSGAQMQGAELYGAQMQGANLYSAQMQGADLYGAQIQRANLYSARMQGANLYSARMQGANLYSARMQGANLVLARMQGADLVLARMQGADLVLARMQGANLVLARMDQNTSLSAAALRGAALREVDCTDLPQIIEHLEEVFGDASVDLPGGQDGPHWPLHWPKIKLEGEVDVDGGAAERFEAEWRKWQADPESYTPPTE